MDVGAFQAKGPARTGARTQGCPWLVGEISKEFLAGALP